jgi:hypothetical protein
VPVFVAKWRRTTFGKDSLFMHSFVVTIWYTAFAYFFTKAAKSISLGYGTLNVLKISESRVSARSPIRLFVLIILIWLPANSPQHGFDAR